MGIAGVVGARPGQRGADPGAAAAVLGQPDHSGVRRGRPHCRSTFRCQWLGAAAIICALSIFGWFAAYGSNRLNDVIDTFQFRPPWRLFICGAPAVALVWGALQFESVMGVRPWSPMVYLGDASYSVYLSHKLAILLFQPLLPGWLVAVFCLPVGIAVYRFLEQPLLRFLRQRRPIPAPRPT
jgi:peptidoglycan/LPS O-acetylase OafA/YrhL